MSVLHPRVAAAMDALLGQRAGENVIARADGLAPRLSGEIALTDRSLVIVSSKLPFGITSTAVAVTDVREVIYDDSWQGPSHHLLEVSTARGTLAFRFGSTALSNGEGKRWRELILAAREAARGGPQKLQAVTTPGVSPQRPSLGDLRAEGPSQVSNREPQRASSSGETAERAWPDPVPLGAAKALMTAVDEFLSTRHLESCKTAFALMRDTMPERSGGINMPWEVWGWFVHVAEQAVALAMPVLAVRLGCFVGEFNDGFAPAASDHPQMLQAEAPARKALETAAWVACGDLDPHARARPGDNITIGEFETILSARLGLSSHETRRASSPMTTLPATVGVSTPTNETDDELVERVAASVSANVAAAQDGDSAADSWLKAGSIIMNDGDSREALALLERAAQSGHVTAMFDAGCTSSRLGEHAAARYWWETGADAGSSDCAWNLAAAYFKDGMLEDASRFYLRTAELGDARGYAALTQMADTAGDEQAERRWAQLGANAGQDFCMHRHGMHLAMGANGDIPTMHRARDMFEAAAEKGNLDAMTMAVNTNARLGERSRAQRFIDMVVSSGDRDEIGLLERYGFL